MRKIVDLEKITAVLLPDGKWHDVHQGSFKADGYISAEGGECDLTKRFSNKDGATWIDAETRKGVGCPISSIQVFNYIPRKNDVCEV
jgi:hypothetical protein